MSIFKSVADIFRPVQQVTMSQQNPGANPAATPPAGTSQPTTPAAPAPNPLDEMKALWQTDPNAKPPVDPLSTPMLNSDPNKIREAAGKIDFMSAVPQDMMQRALQGNDPKALFEVMNAVSQQTLAMATQLSAASAEASARTATQRMLDALPGKVKDVQLRESRPENPILQHEAAQPLLDLARNQLRAKNPGMSVQDINSKVEAMFTSFAESMVGQKKQTEQANLPADTSADWSRFLN